MESWTDLPDEFFLRLQFLQPQVGCLNRCTFCSQEAGRNVWSLSKEQLRELMIGIANEARRRGISVSSGRPHRPGVLFPYLDNDIGSYPYLGEYIQYAREYLDCSTRIATVGYSRHNSLLLGMHRGIAANQSGDIAGFRLSITPYTDGWQAARGELDRNSFVEDWANLLTTYRGLFNETALNERSDGFAIEIRSSPVLGVAREPLRQFEAANQITGVASGPFVVFGRFGGLPLNIKTSRVIDASRTSPQFDGPSFQVALWVSDEFRTMSTQELVRRVNSTSPHPNALVTMATIRKMENADGPYMAIDSEFSHDGHFGAIHMYEQTERRAVSGYLDSYRPLLSAILDVKAANGIARREMFAAADWAHVDQVRNLLTKEVEELGGIYQQRGQFISDEIIPIFDGIIGALRSAGYPASAVFDRSFFVDTGGIVNQGRAKGLFRGLASERDLPITPRQEMGYGEISDSSARGSIWRVSPSVPQGMRVDIGGKNTPKRVNGYIVEELDPEHLRPFKHSDGSPLRTFTIPAADPQLTTYAEGVSRNLLPGTSASG